jgi:tetratricopeptide (TPR) repeat protein
MSGESGPPDFRDALDAFQSGDLDRARAIAEQAVESTPSPNWQHLLGLIHCRLGDPAAGLPHLRAAAEGEPANIGFQVMLARALVDCGRPEDVLAMPEPPPITSGATLALWQALGEAADLARRPDKSKEAWSRVRAAIPEDWRAWSSFGNALVALGEWDEAANALATAVSLKPDEPELRRSAAAAFVQRGKLCQHFLEFDGALSAFRRAYEFDPENLDIACSLGFALERTNRLDELASFLAGLRARGAGEERLGYLSAVLARREGRIEEARNLLLDSDPTDDPVAWHGLRAKLEDALGNVSEAFEASSAMNRASIERSVTVAPGEWERQTEGYRAEQHELARAITPDWASRIPMMDEPSPKRIAFLVGFPRSGTTLLDTFLMGHPDVTVLEEEQLLGKATDGINIKALPGIPRKRIRQARDAYLAALGDRLGNDFSDLVVDKFPLDMAKAPLIQAMFPGVPFIFAQRHPCDVVLSGFMQTFGLVNFSTIEAAADYYDALMSIWTAARETLQLNVHTAVYEDLVLGPEAVIRPLVSFLRLDWDDRVLDHKSTAKSRGTIVTPSYDQVTEPVTTKAAGRWKRYREQLQPVLPILLPWAERLGYSD